MRFSGKRVGSSRKTRANTPPALDEVPEAIPIHNAGATPVEVAPTSPADVPDELIAMRAYELWQRRGCPMGHDSEQDWHAARAQLERERLGWTQAEPEDREKI